MQFFHETLVDLRQVSRYPVVVPERFLLLGVQTFVAEIGFQPVPVVRLAVDDRNQVVGAERFVNIGVGAAVVSFDPLFDPVLGRQQDENGMAELRIVFNGFTQGDPVHFGHPDVADDHFRHLFPGHLDAFRSVIGVQ